MAKKKNNGSGSVKKLPSGTWRGQVMDGYRSDGKKNIVNFTASTKGEVQAMIRNYWYTRDNEMPSDPIQEDCYHTMPFDQWADTCKKQFLHTQFHTKKRLKSFQTFETQI